MPSSLYAVVAVCLALISGCGGVEVARARGPLDGFWRTSGPTELHSETRFLHVALFSLAIDVEVPPDRVYCDASGDPLTDEEVTSRVRRYPLIVRRDGRLQILTENGRLWPVGEFRDGVLLIDDPVWLGRVGRFELLADDAVPVAVRARLIDAMLVRPSGPDGCDPMLEAEVNRIPSP